MSSAQAKSNKNPNCHIVMKFQNLGVVTNFGHYLLTKILGAFLLFFSMYYKHSPTLTSIPERSESAEEVKKWVPKNKHDVLKAKYKCLKKLFQIYDASVIGILPVPSNNEDVDSAEETVVTKKSKRKKRSSRTKTDASAGTSTTASSVIGTDKSDIEQDSTIDPTVMRDIKTCSCTSTKFDATTTYKYASTQDPKEDIGTRRECECTQTCQSIQPIIHNQYILPCEKPKLTRFQCFMQRLFGIRREYKHFVDPNGKIYPASDNNINHTYKEKRRRRGLRFRRLRKPKKSQSESDLMNIKNPTILSYVQSVQKNCLKDTTPRQCPITGCMMISYGIINYNDHLNISHFTDRKYICHYCHEGFKKEYDKYTHENEHLGITKLNLDPNLTSTSTAQQSIKKASNTQTETNGVQEEKLKKIVSFFDKLRYVDQVVSNIKKDRYSECNLMRRHKLGDTDTNSSDGDKRTVSCVNLRRKDKRVYTSSGDSDVTSKYHCSQIACQYCGEKFDSRRQLSLHMDLEHRTHHKYSKFHSCAGIINPHRKRCDMHSEDGQINIQSEGRRTISRIDTSTTLTQDSMSRVKSEETLSCDPSTNIVYYTSMEQLQSSIGSFIQKGGYKWEPGTKIIRV